MYKRQIMLLSLMGGRKKLLGEVEYSKHTLYYILTDLLLSSLLALVYTNDLFTAYVFVEIHTISACGLIMFRQNGRTIEAAVRYMIMSLLGSGLLDVYKRQALVRGNIMTEYEERFSAAGNPICKYVIRR